MAYLEKYNKCTVEELLTKAVNYETRLIEKLSSIEDETERKKSFSVQRIFKPYTEDGSNLNLPYNQSGLDDEYQLPAFKYTIFKKCAEHILGEDWRSELDSKKQLLQDNNYFPTENSEEPADHYFSKQVKIGEFWVNVAILESADKDTGAVIGYFEYILLKDKGYLEAQYEQANELLDDFDNL
tara:strand:+ start:2172 stop:2720 length:549 start_codon:yes stop_codon:yes gene_type:complete